MNGAATGVTNLIETFFRCPAICACLFTVKGGWFGACDRYKQHTELSPDDLQGR